MNQFLFYNYYQSLPFNCQLFIMDHSVHFPLYNNLVEIEIQEKGYIVFILFSPLKFTPF